MSAVDSWGMPATVELCARAFNDGICTGVIYRPQPETIVCGRCGGSEAGVVYERSDLAERLLEASQPAARWITGIRWSATPSTATVSRPMICARRCLRVLRELWHHKGEELRRG